MTAILLFTHLIRPTCWAKLRSIRLILATISGLLLTIAYINSNWWHDSKASSMVMKSVLGSALFSVQRSETVNRFIAKGLYESLPAAAQPQALTMSQGGTLSPYCSVALSGDTAIISNHVIDQLMGAAEIFVRNDGVWKSQQKLAPNTTAKEIRFGRSVALDGNTAVVGANYEGIGHSIIQGAAHIFVVQSPVRGAAYIFVRNGTAWTQQQRLIATDGSDHDSFGTYTAISGDTAIIGSRNGSYAFVRSSATWTQQQKFIPREQCKSCRADFRSVAISGDTAILGSGKGVAYVFVRSGTTWTQQQTLIPSDEDGKPLYDTITDFDVRGVVTAISGDTAIVGSKLRGAYVFVRNGTTWTQKQKLSLPTSGFRSVTSVTISGDTAIIGRDSSSDLRYSAYIFKHSSEGWTLQQKLIVDRDMQKIGFPADAITPVAISGDTALIGAVDHEDRRSLAFAFVREGDGWKQ